MAPAAGGGRPVPRSRPPASGHVWRGRGIRRTRRQSAYQCAWTGIPCAEAAGSLLGNGRKRQVDAIGGLAPDNLEESKSTVSPASPPDVFEVSLGRCDAALAAARDLVFTRGSSCPMARGGASLCGEALGCEGAAFSVVHVVPRRDGRVRVLLVSAAPCWRGKISRGLWCFFLNRWCGFGASERPGCFFPCLWSRQEWGGGKSKPHVHPPNRRRGPSRSPQAHNCSERAYSMCPSCRKLWG